MGFTSWPVKIWVRSANLLRWISRTITLLSLQPICSILHQVPHCEIWILSLTWNVHNWSKSNRYLPIFPIGQWFVFNFKFSDLKHLNVSGNPVQRISADHFRSLHRLESIRLHDMNKLEKIPKPRQFSHLRHLRHFQFYNLPKLNYYNVTKILKHLPPLRSLYIEIKDSQLNKQLKLADCRMLRHVTIRGQNLKTVHPAAFESLRGYRLKLALKSTKVAVFPNEAFR